MPSVADQITLTDTSKKVIRIAQALAKENMNAEFNAAHLLKALMHKDAGLQPLLKSIDQDIYYLEEWADVRIETLPKSTSFKDLVTGDTSVEEIMNEADNIRLKMLKDEIAPEYILAAISTPGVGFTYEQLKTLPLRREQLIGSFTESADMQSAVSKSATGSNGQTPATNHALLKYCVDKTLLAKEGKADIIVGRDKETRMMAEILCRRSKPNVLIAGEPGVGKSALVDGFATAIIQQKVPHILQNARIFELDTGALIAGASYKGEVEDRLKSIITEIKRFDRAILFIDEIHTLVDKHGSAAGAINLLKPELARGELTLIGATSMEEYRKHIENDEAFNRRFELLVVEEPDTTVCFQMIKAVAPRYVQHHGINVPDETIKETIRLSKRYIKDKRLPDAAIDLIDRSMAALGMINDTASKDLEEIAAQFDAWSKDDGEGNTHSTEDWQWLYLQMKNKLSPILWSYYQTEEDPATIKEESVIKDYNGKAIKALREGAMNKHTELEKSDVAAIVSYKTGIPIGKVQTQEKERLLNMESVMKQRVIGQDHGIRVIAEAILESRSGLSKPGQPIGSFFFLGPTGTGKTELTKTLASFLFQDESFMIRFDMSEFKEEQSASLLYGASPGYVGYEEGGLLVNKIRQKPYSVVLFDEIEKAHSSVFDIFLQIMDEGKLHDKLGKEGDFSNAVIIFTSNIGSQYIVDSFGKGEIPSSSKLMEIMAPHFRPEFLGRLTEIIPFAPMTETMVQNILKVQLKSLYAALEKQGISLTISEPALVQLAQMGFTPKYGARPLSGVIRSQLRKPLSRKIISGELVHGSLVKLDLDKKGELAWKIKAGQSEANTTKV
jgi:ATP-dependent Clp protease ATP-binding subunit ClpB